MDSRVIELKEKIIDWYFDYLSNFPERYKQGKIVKPLKYMSMAYHHYNFSKKGLEQIREFEEKAKSVKDETELENLINEYHKKVIKMELGKWSSYFSCAALTCVPWWISRAISNIPEGIGAGASGVGFVGQANSLGKYYMLGTEDADLERVMDKFFGINKYFKEKAEEFRKQIKADNYHS